jgi:hypothetical protein
MDDKIALVAQLNTDIRNGKAERDDESRFKKLPDDNADCAQRRDENGWCERISGEISNFAKCHYTEKKGKCKKGYI